MIEYKSKRAFSLEIEKRGNLFVQEFADISDDEKNKIVEEVERTPYQMMAYELGWMNLILSWEHKESEGFEVITPTREYSWKNLKGLYQSFYVKYESYSLDELCTLFRGALMNILEMVENMSEDELFKIGQRKWADSPNQDWPVWKWIHVNTVAPYKTFRTKLRTWKRNNKTMPDILCIAMEKGRKAIPKGNVATYIPELGKADKNKLGLCILTADGKRYSVGDTKDRFTIQSISKVISMILALEFCPIKEVFDKVGMEPSGEAFNSLVELDLNSNRPFNPMINSGAITVASMLLPKLSFEEILSATRRFCMDPDIEMDEAVFRSEMQTCSRNRAIAYLLESKGIIESDVEKTLELYTKMCSMTVTAESLANLGLVLANGGINYMNGKRMITQSVVQVVKTIMLTCGMYDASGEFAVQVGIPTKSGVGGGLLSVVDQSMGIGIYGPSLDEKGNCIAGNAMLEYLSMKLGLHIFK